MKVRSRRASSFDKLLRLGESASAVGATLADVVRSRVVIPYREDAAAVMTLVG